MPNEEKLETEDLQARAVPPLELPLIIKAGGLGGESRQWYFTIAQPHPLMPRSPLPRGVCYAIVVEKLFNDQV